MLMVIMIIILGILLYRPLFYGTKSEIEKSKRWSNEDTNEKDC